MVYRKPLLWALISLSSHVYSQQGFMGGMCHFSNSIGIKAYWGNVIPHEKVLNPLKKDYVKSVEISYAVNSNNDRIWHRYYNYPTVGISYMFMDLGYSNVLGYSHSIFPYIIFPFTKQGKPFNVNLRVALGLAYITKTYDSLANKENIAISTHLDFYASMGFNISYRLSKSLSSSIGINASHFSNGSIKKPNYGLNILTASCGMSYNFHENCKQTKALELPDIGTTKWLAILSGGLKEVKDPGGSKYGVGSLSLECSKSYMTLLRYGATLDFMYDGSTFVHLREDSIPYRSRLKASKLGLTCMGEIILYRLSMFAGLGIYLYNHDKQVDPIYQRVGLRYRLCNSFYTQIVLKSHFNVADYFEFGIGYKIK